MIIASTLGATKSTIDAQAAAAAATVELRAGIGEGFPIHLNQDILAHSLCDVIIE
jgi:hypothetical protein